jgi:hypothetical protein
MSVKQHIPLAVGVLVIVVTQVLCAWWIARAINVGTTENTVALESIDKTAGEIKEAVYDISTHVTYR